MRDALEALLDFNKTLLVQKPSIGCNIKWIPGREPAWFK